jgi:hypothetical protein
MVLNVSFIAAAVVGAVVLVVEVRDAIRRRRR